MKAVVWTDVFQCGIMVAGILAVCILVGGTHSSLYEEEKYFKSRYPMVQLLRIVFEKFKLIKVTAL